MVWSDTEIAALTREFVTVADEVYLLYPEDPGNLARVADRPEHRFFKKFGEAMPKGDWNHPGTKQGIYMIGPDGEYLEGRFAAGSEPEDIRARLRRALERWDELRKAKQYRNAPVPAVTSGAPPEMDGKAHVLRVFSRDLPRGADDRSGARFDAEQHARQGFLGYLAWAWNEQWLALPTFDGLATERTEWTDVPAELVRQIARTALVDNVRGQAEPWSADGVRIATLQVRRVARDGGAAVLEYQGAFELAERGRSFRGTLRGSGRYEIRAKQLVALDLLAEGLREGGQPFNRRDQDPGPAPLGIAIGLHRVVAEAPAERRE
ncbi:MAG: hypothetical protein RL398_927 [Planctomycetota bacterium]